MQYVQFTEYFDGNATLPTPDAFEKEFAKVMAQVPPPAVSREEVYLAAIKGLAAMKFDQLLDKYRDMARGTVESLVGDLAHSIHVPLVGGLVGRAADRAMGKADLEAHKTEWQNEERRSIRRQTKFSTREALQTLRHGATVQRVSIWGSWVRIDNLRDHSTIVYKPELHRLLAIDAAHKLYRIVSGAASTKPVLPTFVCDTKLTYKPIGPRLIGGLPVQGYHVRSTMLVSNMAVSNGVTIYFWDTPMPAPVLALATGQKSCSPDTPVGRAMPRDRLMVYRALDSSKTTAADESGEHEIALMESQLHRPLTADERALVVKMHAEDATHEAASDTAIPSIKSVQYRGHFRKLTDADRALFEPPLGYRQVQ